MSSASLSIELADEIVKFCLLLQTIHGWRPSGFLLEREMHALMPSVLLGMAGFDALDRNTEPQSPRVCRSKRPSKRI